MMSNMHGTKGVESHQSGGWSNQNLSQFGRCALDQWVSQFVLGFWFVIRRRTSTKLAFVNMSNEANLCYPRLRHASCFVGYTSQFGICFEAQFCFFLPKQEAVAPSLHIHTLTSSHNPQESINSWHTKHNDMSFIGNSFNNTAGKRRSSLQELELAAVVATPTVKRTITTPPSPNPPIYSNIKTQGRVMIYDQDTFAFKMVHDDHHH